MRRVEVGRLSGRGSPFPADPDEAEELLDRLVLCRSLDVTLTVPIDPGRFELGRLRLRIDLARHGRIPPSYWEGRDVNDMRFAHHELLAMVSRERPDPTGAFED